MGSGLWVSSGIWGSGLGLGVSSGVGAPGFWVQGPGVEGLGLGLRVQGSRFGAQSWGLRISSRSGAKGQLWGQGLGSAPGRGLRG